MDSEEPCQGGSNRCPSEPPRWGLERLSDGPVLHLLALLLVLGLGLTTFQDYGISWDEPQQRVIGFFSGSYVTQVLNPDKALMSPEALVDFSTFRDRDYGVVFELPAAALELALGPMDSSEAFKFRHLLTFLVFVVGLVSLVALAHNRGFSPLFALLAACLLLLQPRIFADAFYNSKDIVFLSMFTLGMFGTQRFVERPTPRTAAIAGVLVGLASGVRVVGLFLLALGSSMLLLRLLRSEVRVVASVRAGFIFLATSLASLVLVWPYLWSDPAGNLYTAVRDMSRFRWIGENYFLGAFVPATELPWYYAFVWIGVTTPIFVLSLVLLGCSIVLSQMFRHQWFWHDDASRADFFYLNAALIPLFGTALAGSVLYDGWRQLYFVAPALTMIALRGLLHLWSNRASTLGRLGLAIVVASSASTVSWMVSAHPLQNVYFNAIVAGEARDSFEVDYRGSR